MWTTLDPKKLFGSLITPGKSNYNRIDLQKATKNPKHEYILKYNPGCFFVIKTKTNILKVKYTVHYSNKCREYYPLKWATEVIIFAKIDDNWEILNHWHDSINLDTMLVDNNEESSTREFEISFNVSRKKPELFQICLPSQGRIESIAVSSDSEVEQLYVRPKVAFLGSSIAACTSMSASHSFSAMAYRKYGVNIINCGISGDHTFNCRELMDLLLKTDLKLVIVDILHISEKTLLKYLKNSKCIYYVVTPAAAQYERFDILKYINKEDIAKVTGEGHMDITHLNSAGISYYLSQLRKKGII